MFANFEVCRAGLVRAEIKAKRPRVTTGCLECRRRKKKCDEVLPICSRCKRKGDPLNLVCTRTLSQHPYLPLAEAETQTPWLNEQSQFPSAGSVIPNVDISSLEWSSFGRRPQLEGPPREVAQVKSLPDQGDTAQECFSSLPTKKCHTRARALWSTSSPQPSLEAPLLKIFSHPHERRALESLIERFEPLTISTYTNPELSILAQGLPLAVEYPVVKSAFVACGLAVLFRVSFSQDDYELSMRYYNKAVNTVVSQLLSIPAEPNLSTVLLLHIFEEILCDTNLPEWVHMTGARSLVTSFSRTPPSTVHQLLLLEAYIYHVVISSIFNDTTSDSLPDDYISELLQILSNSSQCICAGPIWKTSAIIGSAHEVFDYVFRISQLRRRLPLQGPDLEEASRLMDILHISKLPVLGSLNSHLQLGPPAEMILTTHLYTLACVLILSKLLDLTLSSFSPLSRNIISRALTIYAQLPEAELPRPILMWPSIILGCAAVSQEERKIFCKPFEESIKQKGLGSAVQSYTFLKRAWEVDCTLGRALGLDVLLREDLLCCVFL
ncbi:fungal-specific transcription factor domain-containing protein [Tricladium varicosporioides]|nr:fungal-specific transcription factor domain-containing protein [Hymenoscyphus varicosporioides]